VRWHGLAFIDTIALFRNFTPDWLLMLLSSDPLRPTPKPPQYTSSMQLPSKLYNRDASQPESLAGVAAISAGAGCGL
jgi:hypothetical protein